MAPNNETTSTSSSAAAPDEATSTTPSPTSMGTPSKGGPEADDFAEKFGKAMAMTAAISVSSRQQQKQQLQTEDGEEAFLKKLRQGRHSPLSRVVWRNVVLFVYLHAGFLYGAYLVLSFQIMFFTFVWAFILSIASGMGITAGAHRLWAHRSYKARLPLRLFLCLLNSMAFQNDIYEWCRDHRVHHKFTETDADPHNALRGFFFSHMGWLLCRKHPEVIKKGSTVDMSDLLADPVIRFQKRFYLSLVTLMCFVFPVWVPCYIWGETVWKAFFVCALARYCFTLHCTWLVNSAAHLWGDKPYDKQINPSENLFATVMTVGEGYHNYHHTFPWDYAASEWGTKINISTFCINLWARLGLAYDLKTVTQEIVDRRREKMGDETAPWYDKNKVAKS